MKEVNYIINKLGDSFDLTYKEIKVLDKKIYLLYLNTISDSNIITSTILKPLEDINLFKNDTFNIKEYLTNTILNGSIISIKNKDIIHYLYQGLAILVLNDKESLIIETRMSLDRGVSSSTDEPILRGSKDSFTESFIKNIGLVRKRIRNEDLVIKQFIVGKYSKTNISVLSISSIADDVLVNNIYNKINKLDVDGIIDSGYLRELICDNKHNMFPTVMSTERPDKTSQALLEGKIAVIVDNSPYALIMPTFFIDFFKVPEDYYVKTFTTNFARFLRTISFLISLLLPAIYIAVTTHNKESIPTSLLLSFSQARIDVPFPALIECLLLIIVFEILKESDLRLPNILGTSVNVLGALILGEAAISAGIVSPIMVIVVSLTLISGFVFTDVDFISSIRWWRILFLLSASLLGLYGILFLSILFTLKLCSIESYNKPYMYPISPFDKSEIKDSFIRLNKKKLNIRNKILTKNKYRMR